MFGILKKILSEELTVFKPLENQLNDIFLDITDNFYDFLCLLCQYLGKTHNLWHRACLLLEQLAFDNSAQQALKNRPGSEYEFEPTQSSQQVSPLRDFLSFGLSSMYRFFFKPRQNDFI